MGGCECYARECALVINSPARQHVNKRVDGAKLATVPREIYGINTMWLMPPCEGVDLVLSVAHNFRIPQAVEVNKLGLNR